MFGRFGLEVGWLRLSPKAKPMVRRGAVDLGHSPPLALPNGVGKFSVVVVRDQEAPDVTAFILAR